MIGATESEVRTCCRCCPAGCGIVVTVDARGRATGVRGDRDHPISHGYTCPKGRALAEFHHHPERLDRPLLRAPGRVAVAVAVAGPPDGSLPDRSASNGADTGWSGVLDDLGPVERHGPDSVGLYRATGTSPDTLGCRAGERFVR
jgi:hypothetical protein